MYGHKKMLDDLLQHKNGVNVHSIHFVNRVMLQEECKIRLSSVGLGQHEIVTFTVTGFSYCNGVLNKNNNLEGSLTNIITERGIEQVIFIPSEVPAEPELSPPYQEEWSCMLKLTALAHELGHASDIQRKESNFKFTSTPSVDLIGAEAYAHAYSIEYLNKIGAHVARNTLARALYKASASSKKFELNLYLALCKEIGKGRLKRWAS